MSLADYRATTKKPSKAPRPSGAAPRRRTPPKPPNTPPPPPGAPTEPQTPPAPGARSPAAEARQQQARAEAVGPGRLAWESQVFGLPCYLRKFRLLDAGQAAQLDALFHQLTTTTP